MGRVVEGDSDVEEGNDKGHAHRLGFHGPVTASLGVVSEDTSGHMGFRPYESARLVDRYRYGMPRGLEQTSGVPISFVVGLS